MLSLDTLSAQQIAAGVAAGDFSATEVANAALAAIDEREGAVQAFLQVSPQLALDAAARIDAARAAGEALPPLAGVPLAIKDNMNLVGTRTTCASNMLANYESVYTATCVQRMLDAGCLPVGKANMDEFAFGSSTESSAFHPTNNPWDVERVRAALRADLPPRSLPARSPWPWAPIPADRSASPHRSAAWWA